MERRKRKDKTFVVRLMLLIVVVLVLAAAAILRSGKLFGHDIADAAAPKTEAKSGEVLTTESDGSMVVDTKTLAADVHGYGGPVPLRIHINVNGVVTSIEALPNAESGEFFGKAKALFSRWQGKTIDEAMGEEVDAVSGATFSSKAIIENVRRGLAYAKNNMPDAAADTATARSVEAGNGGSAMAIGGIAALIVALLGAMVPIFTGNRRWHYVQLALNVVVLGLWTGTFVSYALFMRLFAEGVSMHTLGMLAAPLVMVIVALVYPLAGRSGYYCANVCPFGSAQELAGKLAKRKWRTSATLNRRLTTLRSLLWAVLMVLMLTGTWTAWMDYELFTAFLYTSASVWVTVVAALFLVVSVWVPRPYCRFVCPTGMLIRI